MNYELENPAICDNCLNSEICVLHADESPMKNCPWFRDWHDILK